MWCSSRRGSRGRDARRERPDLEGMREVSAPEGSPVTWRYRGEPPPSHEATAFGLLGVVPLSWGITHPSPQSLWGCSSCIAYQGNGCPHARRVSEDTLAPVCRSYLVEEVGVCASGRGDCPLPGFRSAVKKFFLTLSPYGEYALFDWLLVRFFEPVSYVRLAAYPLRTSSLMP